MKVFNLTDVATPALTARGLAGQQIVVGTELIAPGASAEVEDTPHRRKQVASLVEAGALAIDKLPPAYIRVKGAVLAPIVPPALLEPLPFSTAPAEVAYLEKWDPLSDPPDAPIVESTPEIAPPPFEGRKKNKKKR